MISSWCENALSHLVAVTFVKLGNVCVCVCQCVNEGQIVQHIYKCIPLAPHPELHFLQNLQRPNVIFYKSVQKGYLQHFVDVVVFMLLY